MAYAAKQSSLCRALTAQFHTKWISDQPGAAHDFDAGQKPDTEDSVEYSYKSLNDVDQSGNEGDGDKGSVFLRGIDSDSEEEDVDQPREAPATRNIRFAEQGPQQRGGGQSSSGQESQSQQPRQRTLRWGKNVGR